MALLDDRDGQPTVAWAAIYALKRLGPVATAALPTLTALVSEAGRPLNERQAALIALGQIDPKGKVVLPALEAALRDESVATGGAYIALGAAIAVRDMGKPAASLLPALIAAYETNEARAAPKTARDYLAAALDAIGPAGRSALKTLRTR